MAQFTIDQAGLSAGTLDKSRTDGLSTGALVTLDASAGGGDTFLFELLWVPVGDTTAVSTLADTANPAIWTFAPSSGFFGTYRIRLTIDAGSATESVIIRHFVVRTASKGLIIPPLNGIADSDASLLNSGAAAIAASEDNSTDYTSNAILNNFAYAGWWRALYEVIQQVESGVAGATDFVSLTDTPASYAGSALLFARVNAGETALEFVAASSSLQDAYDGGNTIGTASGVPIVLSGNATGSSGPTLLIRSLEATNDIFIAVGVGSSGDLMTVGTVSGFVVDLTLGDSVNKPITLSTGGTGLFSIVAAGGLSINDGTDVGTSTQVLTSNGTLATWGDAASAAGSSTQVQFNTGGAFAASSDFTFDGSELALGVSAIRLAGLSATPALVMKSQATNQGAQVIFQESTGGASRFFMSYLETSNEIEFQASSATSMLWKFDGDIPMLMKSGLLDLGGSTIATTVIGVAGQRKQLNDTKTSNAAVTAASTLDLVLPEVTVSKTEIYNVKVKTLTGTTYDYYRGTIIVQRDGTSTLINRTVPVSGFLNPDFVISAEVASDIITITFENNSGTDTDDTTITASIESEDIPA